MTKRIGATAVLVLAAGAVTLPLVVAAVGSFSDDAALVGGSWWPRSPSFANYVELFRSSGFWIPIRNSLVVAATTTVLCLVIGSGCAYALARLRFPGRNLALGIVLAIAMFPQIAIVSPLYLLLRRLGLIDTYPGLVLPYVTFALPLAIWLLVGFFRQLPRQIEDAARIDGASDLRVLLEVVLPLTAPALATTAILTFIYCWNEFLFALSFTVSPDRQTVPVAIAMFRGRFQVPWGQVLAASIVATAPVAAVVLAFQRRIAQGLVAGGVKG